MHARPFRRRHRMIKAQHRGMVVVVLDSRVTAPAAAALYRVQHPTCPVLEQPGNVADGVAVWKQVPPPRAVAVVVEPGPKDEIRCDGEEDAVGG